MTGQVIELVEQETNSTATISTRGASLLALSLSGKELIQEPNDPEAKFFAGVVMAPWSGRTESGMWSLPDGRELQLEINEPERNNALHGLVFDKEFKVQRSTKSSVELSIDLAATSGYPFSLKLVISYELDNGELFCGFTVKNLSGEIAPFGIGFHPYFTGLGSGELMVVQNDAASFLVLDERLLSKGKLPTAGSEKDLSVGKLVSDAHLDDCYTDLVISQGVSVTKLVDSSGSGMELWQDEVFRNTVIYTTDEFPATAGPVTAIAIEPSTAGVNALNTKQDLLLIAAGQTRSGSWGIKLI